MTTHRKSVLLFAVAAALSAAQAKPSIHTSGMPAPEKVGGLTAVLTEANWQSCLRIDSLEYRDESVSPSALSHDELFYRVSLRNLRA